MTTIPGDAETLRQLGDILIAHRGDAEAWKRLGGELRSQRTLIGYGNRRRFAEERGLPNGLGDNPNAAYKFIYDLEGGLRWGRKGFPAEKMPAIAAAWGVTLGSIGAVLDGTGHLVPLPAAIADPDPPPAVPPPAVRMSGVLSDTAIVAAAPYATAILTTLRDLAAQGNMQPSGHDVFPDDWRAARRWREYDDMPEEERVWLIAALQADADTSARPDTGTG